MVGDDRDGEEAARDRDERWNIRRKKTLIMKGLENPTQETVIRSLVQYGIATGKEVVRVTVRQVKGVKHKDWAFVLMISEQAVEDSFRKRFYLKGTPLYIQKDLSWEERRRLKEQREKEAAADHQYRSAPLPSIPGLQSRVQPFSNTVSPQPVLPPNAQHGPAPWIHPKFQQLDRSMGHSQFPDFQDPYGHPAPMQDSELEPRTFI